MKITFNINFHTVWGQKICIVGSIPQLGAWDLSLAREMNYAGDGNWQLVLDVEYSPGDSAIEYRYFLSINDKHFFEEWEKNHRLVPDCKSTIYTLYDYWQSCPQNLSFYSSAFTKAIFAHTNAKPVDVIRSRKKLSIKVSAPQVETKQSIAIAGNQECLGSWSSGKALRLGSDMFPEWYIELDAAEISYPLEYKFLLVDDETGEPLCWETRDNRVLNLPELRDGETVIVSGLTFRCDLAEWRCAGSVTPVFSLRSEQSFGVGDLGDLSLLVDWLANTSQKIIQVLPMNDTTMTHSWRDSYPYSAISVYALHPMYINLRQMGCLNDKEREAFYVAKQQELNEKFTVDYETVNKYKIAYCREFFEQEGKAILDTDGFHDFYSLNKEWLVPYAAYCHLRDRFETSDFSCWGDYAVYTGHLVEQLAVEDNEAWGDISFTYFIQYVLHNQFKAVSNYARKQGVILKGDLPIGVNRTSVDAWKESRFFNMEGCAGAPPDDFSIIGQNWMFPTYNWEEMEKDNFFWWKNRFTKLGDYFDAFRIDHILGFFRIWEIPTDYVQGLCGHFNPALPLTKEEIELQGFPFDEKYFTNPHISHGNLSQFMEDLAGEVEETYLQKTTADSLQLKPFCDTQRKIEQLFSGKTDPVSIRIKNGLFTIANEVLFLKDPREPDKYHPRISGNQSFVYKELDASAQFAFDQLYWDFFYHRHNDFWKKQAYKRLTPLVASTEMLVCGEDLGMIPQSVPEVMCKLQILSLEIERMPKVSNREFSDMSNLPYLSVCTTSTHDMSPLRSWWKEDTDKTQRYYNQVLHRAGKAPEDCTDELATQIIANHLASRSMLVAIPLQDWFAMDDSIKCADIDSERINVPSNPNHYWCYRMHISLEKLLVADSLNDKIRNMIRVSGRI